MGVFEWLRGKPRDTQEERAEVRRQAEGREASPGSETPQDIEAQAALRHDEEAARHGGI
jgi:hypothetical protein